MSGCVLLPAVGREAGERAARAAGMSPELVLTKQDCAGRVGPLRRRARELGLDTFALHSAEWARQPMIQFYELAALRMGLPETLFLEADGTVSTRRSRAWLARRAATLPAEVAGAAALASAESARLGRARRRAPGTPSVGEEAAVLAIWNGSFGNAVGGSVTHISGILGGFRRAGLRTGLVTIGPPPPQIAAVVDELEVVDPMPRSARLTGEMALVGANRHMRRAAQRLAARLRPAFVYQRYDAFVTCGIDLAERTGLPGVLEWNGSEVWTRTNWQSDRRLKNALGPLLRSAERYVAERSTLVCSVSEHAAQMALDAGTPPERSLVSPNAVDIDAIDAGRALAPDGARPGRIGWVGSFGSWHGADVLVRALAQLPADVTAVMVGDGGERPACEALARELGVRERIDFTGALPHEQAVARLAASELLASPHVPLPGQPFFGSPTKLFEYMAIGRPVVASGLEQIGDVLRDAETAVIVEPGDVDDLARGIRAVLERPDRGVALGEAARREAEAEHTWEQRARAILSGVEDAVGTRVRTGQEVTPV
jgi:glycosyltransferase involved in cell wall biosynthesis